MLKIFRFYYHPQANPNRLFFAFANPPRTFYCVRGPFSNTYFCPCRPALLECPVFYLFKYPVFVVVVVGDEEGDFLFVLKGVAAKKFVNTFLASEKGLFSSFAECAVSFLHFPQLTVVESLYSIVTLPHHYNIFHNRSRCQVPLCL